MSRQAVILLCSFIALWCVISAFDNFNDVRGAVFVRSEAYKTTTGEILSSSVAQYYDGKRRPTNREDRHTYGYVILYRYVVAGKNYTSDQVSFTSKLVSSHPAYAEKYVNKYPVGRTVTVYYKADEPSFAVLEPQNKFGGLFGFMGLLIVFILSLLGIVTQRNVRRNQQRPTKR